MPATCYDFIPIDFNTTDRHIVHDTFALNGLNVHNQDVKHVIGAMYHFGNLKKTFKRDKAFKQNVRDAVEKDLGFLHKTHSLLPFNDYYRSHDHEKEKLYGALLDADQNSVLIAVAQMIDKNQIEGHKRLYTGNAAEEHSAYYKEMMQDLFTPEENPLKTFFRDSYQYVKDALHIPIRKNKKELV